MCKKQGLRRKEFLRAQEKMVLDLKNNFKKLQFQIDSFSKNTCEKNNQVFKKIIDYLIFLLKKPKILSRLLKKTRDKMRIISI